MIVPQHIAPDAVFDDGAIVLTLGISSAELTRARRSGELRFARKGNRILYRGQWLLDWLDHVPDGGKAHDD